jgi:hypothetical protein
MCNFTVAKEGAGDDDQKKKKGGVIVAISPQPTIPSLQ